MDALGPIPRLRSLARLSARDADVVLRLIEHRLRLSPASPTTEHGLRRLHVYRRALGLPQGVLLHEGPWLAVEPAPRSHA